MSEAQNAVFICPCELRGPLHETYASILVLGGGSVQAALDTSVASAGVAVQASHHGERSETPLGVSSVKAALDADVAERTGAVANTCSYCARCRRITPSLNAARSVQENVIHWQKQRAHFVACAAFIAAWPKLARGSRQRSRRKKQVKVEADEEA